jgi:hypothetical protein
VQAILEPGRAPYVQKPPTVAEASLKAQPSGVRPASLPPPSREEPPAPDKRKVKRGEQVDALPKNPY